MGLKLGKEFEKEYDDVAWINPNYDYLRVWRDGKMGLADKDNDIKIPIEYDEVKDASHNEYFPVRKGNKWGIYKIKKYGNGKLIIPIKHKEIKIGRGDTFDVENGGKYEQTSFDNWELEDYSEYETTFSLNHSKLLLAKKDGKWGVIDKNKNVIVKIQYDKYNSFSYNHNYYTFFKGKKIGLWSSIEGWIIPPSDKIKIYKEDGDFKVVYFGMQYENRTIDRYEIISELFENPTKYKAPGY